MYVCMYVCAMCISIFILLSSEVLILINVCVCMHVFRSISLFNNKRFLKNFSFLFEISDAVGKVHGRMQKAYALYSKKLADGTLVGNNRSGTYSDST